MTNGTAIGYMILAMQSLGYTKKQIQAVEHEMRYKMDMVDEESAKDTYSNF